MGTGNLSKRVNMKKTSKRIIKSFKDAISGIIYIFRTQRNYRIQVVLFILVICAAALLELSFPETAVIIFAGGLVLVGEMINTGLEKLVDLISPEYNKLAGIIKDISAAVVLVAAIIAVIIGLIIFIPAIIELF